MRLFALSLAAALAGIVALPAMGAPDPLQAALRSWDAVIHDGRSGEALPLQVIVVLAAPPAVSIDSPQASKLAGSTQQLDLDALTSKGIWMKVQYRFVNAINAVSATVRPDQLAQLRAAPEVAGVYPVRKLYPAATVARHLASLGAAARPLTLYGADGAGVRVALLDGPVDSGHSYLHLSGPGWNAVDGKPQAARPDPVAAEHGTAMAGIVAGQGGPAGLHGVAPAATLLPIQILELQHGDLMGTTATLLAGLDRALDPNGDGNLSDHANVILAPVAEPFASFGASAETVASENVEKLGAVLVAAAGNDGPTDARFGTIASPAASPGWLAVGATDGRAKLPRANLTLRADGSENTLNDVPLVSALKPDDGVALALVLPSGPTESDIARAPADIATGASEGDFRAPDSTSLVRGKAVLLPRDGAPIAQRAAAAMAAGASALVLYGDGGAPAGSLGLDDDAALPITVISGEEGAAAAATLITGGRVTMWFTGAAADANPAVGSVAPFSSTGLTFDDAVKPDLVAPGIAITTSNAGGGYVAVSGTSVAAAQVAGAAALLRQAHASWAPRVIRGALVGTANSARGLDGDGTAPVEAQGGGAVDVEAAMATNVIASPATLTFGLARSSRVKVNRVLTLTNTSGATIHVSLSLGNDGEGADGATIRLGGAPSGLAIAPGASVPVPLTLRANGLPKETAVIGGWLRIASDGGGTLRVPWALARSDDLAVGLIGAAALNPVRVQPSTDGSAATRLSLVLGKATSHGAARLEIAPVQRLSVDLYQKSRLLGRLVERHELLPGSYRYGITGIDPSTGKALEPGVYKLVVDAVSSDEVTSERQLGFTVSG